MILNWKWGWEGDKSKILGAPAERGPAEVQGSGFRVHVFEDKNRNRIKGKSSATSANFDFGQFRFWPANGGPVQYQYDCNCIYDVIDWN